MTTYAFCLGVNSYRQPIDSLKCAERDARDLAAVLEHGLGFDAEYLEERKTEDIEERIENLESCLQPGDQFIFYFSGHGKAHGDDQYFLLPGCRYESLEDGHAVTGGVLSWNTLKRLTSRPKWRGVHRVFIFDACRTPLVPVKGAGERPSFDGRYLLRDPRPARSDREAPPLTLINSCDEGTCAIELPGRGNGVFTTALIEHFRQAADNGEDIRLDEGFVGRLAAHMERVMREAGCGELAQRPVWRGMAAVLPLHRRLSPVVARDTLLDERLWRLARHENTVAAYKDYVKEAPPEAQHIDDALVAIAALQKPAAPTEPPPPPAVPPAPTFTAGQVFRDAFLDGSGEGPEMVVIPAGSFEMGSETGGLLRGLFGGAYAEETPRHTVRIARPFALAKTPVTQTQWRAVMGSDPPELAFKGCDDCPVERVSWHDAQEYVGKLSEKTGQHYRLPSEAEWEYAAKAGGNYQYAGSDKPATVAWYRENSENKTHPVAQKRPNAFGLCDMSGNVCEWVEDCWNGDYTGAPSDGSAWTTGDCARRVLRGGSWGDFPQNVRAARRFRGDTSNPNSNDGFRPARMLP